MSTPYSYPPQGAPQAQPVIVAIQEQSSGVNIAELWCMLIARKWFILCVSGVFAVAAVVYALWATPIFRAEVVLAPASVNAGPPGLSRLSGLASLAGINLGSGNDKVEAVALLQSKTFIANFIQDLDLLPVIFADQWDAAAKKWRSDDPAEQPDLRDGVRYFTENVRFVTEDPATGLVTLAIEWTDPEVAADWAMKLVERINENTRRRDIEESQRKLDYLHDQLAKANLVELRQAISSVIEEQINAMMLAQAQHEYAFTVIDPAIPPKLRVRPKRTLIVIIATALGGILGTLVVLLRYALTSQANPNGSEDGRDREMASQSATPTP